MKLNIILFGYVILKHDNDVFVTFFLELLSFSLAFGGSSCVGKCQNDCVCIENDAIRKYIISIQNLLRIFLLIVFFFPKHVNSSITKNTLFRIRKHI